MNTVSKEEARKEYNSKDFYEKYSPEEREQIYKILSKPEIPQERKKINEYDALCILEIAFPGITCGEAKEALNRLKEKGIVEPFEK